MRSARMLGLVLVAAMPLVGCGEAVGPPEGEGGATDLEFVLPPLQGDVPLNTGAVVAPPKAWVDSIVAAKEGALAISTETAARIDAVYLVAGFNEFTLWFEYGMYGFGSGYSMSMDYAIYRENGTLRTGQHKGISLSLGPINTTFVPWVRDSVFVPYKCGLDATFNASYTIYFGVDAGTLKLATAAERNKTASTYQPACSPAPSGGGEGGEPGGELTPVATVTRYTICYYELWVDSTGTVVSVVPAGCEPYTGQIV